MAAKVLSIEIGANFTRLCLTDYKAKAPKVYKYAKVATPDGVIVDGEIQSTPEFVSLLKETIQKNGLKSKQAVFPITSSKVASREAVIPNVKEKQIDAVVRTNIKEYFPIDLSQHELGYINMGEAPDATGTIGRKLLLLAVPKTLLESYRNLAKALGMEMVACDYSGNSIYEMVKNECKDGVKMVIKADETSSVVTIIENQAIVLQRNVAYGVDDAINTVVSQPAFDANDYDSALDLMMRKYCLSFSLSAQGAPRSTVMPAGESALDRDAAADRDYEAAGAAGEEKAVKAVSDEEEPDTSAEDSDATLFAAKQEVTGSLRMLINGIARIMDYYGSRNQGKVIDNIYLTGIGSEISGLAKLLTSELGVKTVGLKHLEGQSLEKSFADGRFSEYITAIGAAVNPVGFVGGGSDNGKKGKQDAGQTGATNYLPLGILVLLAGLVVGGALIFKSYTELQSQKTRLANDNVKLASMDEIRAIYMDYQNAKVADEQVRVIYDMTRNHNEDLLAFLSELEQVLPSSATIKTFSAAETTVTMSFTVPGKVEMANVVQQLRNMSTIDTLTVAGITDSYEIPMEVEAMEEVLEELGEDVEETEEEAAPAEETTGPYWANSEFGIDLNGVHNVTFSVTCFYKTQEQIEAENGASN